MADNFGVEISRNGAIRSTLIPAAGDTQTREQADAQAARLVGQLRAEVTPGVTLTVRTVRLGSRYQTMKSGHGEPVAVTAPEPHADEPSYRLRHSDPRTRTAAGHVPTTHLR